MIISLRHNQQLWQNLLLVGLIAMIVLLAPWFLKYDPYLQVEPSTTAYTPPSLQHWFGTDQFGRDVFVRVLYGGRLSLFIALSVVLFSVSFGTLYGAVSGFLGGLWDEIMMRLVDILLAFPVIFLAVICMALFGTGIFWLIVVLTITSWMDVARLVRAEVHSIKQRPYIMKARAAGLKKIRILLQHILPNVMATVTTVAVIRVADIILLESALSFLGLGVRPPAASWGSIISDGRTVLASAWWIALFPGLSIVVTIMSLQKLGESLQIKQI